MQFGCINVDLGIKHLLGVIPKDPGSAWKYTKGLIDADFISTALFPLEGNLKRIFF